MKPFILLALLAIFFASGAQNANNMSTQQSGNENQIVTARYIVKDVDASVSFYTEMLGFHIEQHVKSAFANLSIGNLRLLINRPGAGGAGQAMPDGTLPAPGAVESYPDHC